MESRLTRRTPIEATKPASTRKSAGYGFLGFTSVVAAVGTLASVQLLRLGGVVLWLAIAQSLLCLTLAWVSFQHQQLLHRRAELRRHEEPQGSVGAPSPEADATNLSPRQLDEQSALLLQAQRVELLPHLAGSLAHDINNQMSIIQGATDMVAYALAADDASQQDLASIRDAVQRLKDLNRQLVSWSRPLVFDDDKATATDAVNGLLPALRRLLGTKTELLVDLPEAITTPGLSPSSLAQIILQLILNAKDALGDNPVIKLSLRSTEDGTVVLTVQDNGHGIAPHAQKKIFDPFFTTKSDGRHLGLGLASVRSIVERVGGRIELTSNPHEAGTLVSVSLPKTKDSVMTANDSKLTPSATAPSVLVLDDEETVRRLLVRLLTRDGYQIAEASTLKEAMAKAGALDRLDVWVTDANVNGTDATTGVAEMRRLHPGVAIVLISGRDPEPDRMQELTAQGVRFLAKPFVPAELRQAIDEAYRHGSATSAVVPLPQETVPEHVRQAR